MKKMPITMDGAVASPFRLRAAGSRQPRETSITYVFPGSEIRVEVSPDIPIGRVQRINRFFLLEAPYAVTLNFALDSRVTGYCVNERAHNLNFLALRLEEGDIAVGREFKLCLRKAFLLRNNATVYYARVLCSEDDLNTERNQGVIFNPTLEIFNCRILLPAEFADSLLSVGNHEFVKYVLEQEEAAVFTLLTGIASEESNHEKLGLYLEILEGCLRRPGATKRKGLILLAYSLMLSKLIKANESVSGKLQRSKAEKIEIALKKLRSKTNDKPYFLAALITLDRGKAGDFISAIDEDERIPFANALLNINLPHIQEFLEAFDLT